MILALLPERNPFYSAFRWFRSFLASPPANLSRAFGSKMHSGHTHQAIAPFAEAARTLKP